MKWWTNWFINRIRAWKQARDLRKEMDSKPWIKLYYLPEQGYFATFCSQLEGYQREMYAESEIFESGYRCMNTVTYNFNLQKCLCDTAEEAIGHAYAALMYRLNDFSEDWEQVSKTAREVKIIIGLSAIEAEVNNGR